MTFFILGQVAACAGCNAMHPWASAITGIGAGLSYLFFSWLCLKLKVDDPLDAFGVHFGGGLWGLISICLVGDKGILYGLFDSSVNMRQAGAVSPTQTFLRFGIVFLATWMATNLRFGHHSLVIILRVYNVFHNEENTSFESISGN